MNMLFIEIPVVANSTNDGLRIIEADSPPLQLLGIASAAKSAGIETHLLTLVDAWSEVLSSGGTAEDFLHEIADLSADVIVLCIDSFNFFGANKFLQKLSNLSSSLQKPAVFVGGVYPTLFPKFFFDSPAVQAILVHGSELLLPAFFESLKSLSPLRFQDVDSFKAVWTRQSKTEIVKSLRDNSYLPIFEMIPQWVRWERGISLGETFGFPLEALPHFLNLPIGVHEIYPPVEVFLKQSVELLDALRQPEIHINVPHLSWNRTFLDSLGKTAIQALETKDQTINFRVRATPADLLSHSVLPSLSLIDVKSLSIQAGNIEGRQNVGFDESLVELEECVRTVKSCGLSSKTDISKIIAVPHQTIEEILQIVQETVRIAVKYAIAQVTFEWWYNVPGSSSYRASESWSDLINNSPQPWFSDIDAVSKIPDVISPDERKTVRSTIEIHRELNNFLRVVGPDFSALC